MSAAVRILNVPSNAVRLGAGGRLGVHEQGAAMPFRGDENA